VNTRALRSRNVISKTRIAKTTKSGKSDTEVSEISEEPTPVLTTKRSAVGKAITRKTKTRSKVAEVDSEGPEDKENEPVPTTRGGSRAPAKRVRKEVKEEPVLVDEVVDAPRMTRTRARKLK
jgi:hypothetical protein